MTPYSHRCSLLAGWILFSGVAAFELNLGAAALESGASKADATSSESKAGTVENSVVKVFSTARYPDFYKPWTKQAPSEATGTGVVIEGKRILSNAHVVLWASQVQIQANQAGDKISATVEAVGGLSDVGPELLGADRLAGVVPAERVHGLLEAPVKVRQAPRDAAVDAQRVDHGALLEE